MQSDIDNELQKSLKSLLTQRKIPPKSLQKLKPLLEKEDSQLFFRMLKKLPDDMYYNATLKLRENDPKSSQFQKLTNNLQRLQKQYPFLKALKQLVIQNELFCLDILKDIKDHFKCLRTKNYRQEMIQFLQQLEDMTPQRFILFILHHPNNQDLSKEDWETLLYVKEKIYPIQEKKSVKSAKCQQKRQYEQKTQSIKIQQMKGSISTNNFVGNKEFQYNQIKVQNTNNTNINGSKSTIQGQNNNKVQQNSKSNESTENSENSSKKDQSNVSNNNSLLKFQNNTNLQINPPNINPTFIVNVERNSDKNKEHSEQQQSQQQHMQQFYPAREHQQKQRSFSQEQQSDLEYEQDDDQWDQ